MLDRLGKSVGGSPNQLRLGWRDSEDLTQTAADARYARDRRLNRQASAHIAHGKIRFLADCLGWPLDA